MAESFPVLALKADSPNLTEQLGSKPKFWFYMAEDEQPWLFKYARDGTGEHWAEKVAAELAVRIELPAAHVELAEFADKLGSASRSFVRRKEGWNLVHGDELLAGHVIGYDREKTFRQSSHSISNIVQAISAVFPDKGAREVQLTQFAGLMVLDALIGNTDRHHQNWGILRRVAPDGTIEQLLAPSFDHASALGRNVSAEERKRRLKEKTVLAYVRRGKGGIFWKSSENKGANPLALVELATQNWPVYFRPWLSRVQLLAESDFRAIVERIPDRWMDSSQKMFCLALLCSTCSELKKLSP